MTLNCDCDSYTHLLLLVFLFGVADAVVISVCYQPSCIVNQKS